MIYWRKGKEGQPCLHFGKWNGKDAGHLKSCSFKKLLSIFAQQAKAKESICVSKIHIRQWVVFMLPLHSISLWQPWKNTKANYGTWVQNFLTCMQGNSLLHLHYMRWWHFSENAKAINGNWRHTFLTCMQGIVMLPHTY